MSEIFISYAREDQETARSLASILKARGFSVWWDRKIPPGKTFDEAIEDALQEAECVVVLWSESSTESDFVKDEAQRAADRGILVPALIDEVQIPLGFGRLQTANLVGWQGGEGHLELDRLLRSLAATVGRPMPSASSIFDEAPPPARPPAEEDSGAPPRQPPGRALLFAGAAVAALAAVAVAGWMLYSRPSPPPEPEPPPPAGEPAEVEGETAIPEDPDAAAPEDPPAFDAAAILGELEELEELGADAGVLDEDLLRGYRELRSEGRDALEEEQAQEVLRTMEALEASVEGFAELKGMDQRQDTPFFDQLEAWRSYAPAREASPSATQREERIAELEAVRRDSATIVAEDRFVTSRGVAKDPSGKATGPSGVADTLSEGPIHVFAWVRAPRERESLRLEWLESDGTVAKAQDVTVYRNEEPGYRFHYYRNVGEPGAYEVRLYNGSGTLIGRRRFEVTAGTRSRAQARFVDRGDDTVADRQTGRLWTREEISSGEGLRWEQAVAGCQNLTLGGRRDWRLPSIAELWSLLDPPDARGTIELGSLGLLWSSEKVAEGVLQLDVANRQQVANRPRKRNSGALCIAGGS